MIGIKSSITVIEIISVQYMSSVDQAVKLFISYSDLRISDV